MSEIIENMVLSLIFFTGNIIFPSIAENKENMIFTLSVFKKIFHVLTIIDQSGYLL